MRNAAFLCPASRRPFVHDFPPHFSHANITARQKVADKTGEPEANKFLVTIGADVPPDVYEARVVGRFGVSNPRAYVVGHLPEIPSPATNHAVASAVEVALGTVVNGRTEANAVDYFKFAARKGQRVLIECLAKEIDSRMDDTLILYDAGGHELERQRRGGLLDFIAPADGQFVLALSDFIYRGGREYFYRLTVGAGPHLDYILPPSGLPGAKGNYTLYGRNLPGGKRRVQAGGGCARWNPIPAPDATRRFKPGVAELRHRAGRGRTGAERQIAVGAENFTAV